MRQKVRADKNLSEQKSDADDLYLLDDYESDTDSNEKTKAEVPGDDGLSAETKALMSKLGMNTGDQHAQEELEPEDELKIFYCSRTHSQLSQFINELRRVKLPPSVPEGEDHVGSGHDAMKEIQEDIKHLTLGSRKNLCINPKVSKLGNATAINEKCLELQQPGTPADLKCPCLPKKEGEATLNDFRDHTMAKIRDIEDMGVLGKTLGVCPYYASRPAIAASEVRIS